MASNMIEECGICQVETTNVSVEFVTLPCAGHHAFHPDCIKQWLSGGHRRNSNCPFCRAPLRHTCGHALNDQHIQAGKVIDSSVLAGPCRLGCSGYVDPLRRQGLQMLQRLRVVIQRETGLRGYRIRPSSEEIDNKLRLYQQNLTATLYGVNRRGLAQYVPELIPSIMELHDMRRRRLLGLPTREQMMPNPLRAGHSTGSRYQPPRERYQPPQQHTFESAFESNARNIPSNSASSNVSNMTNNFAGSTYQPPPQQTCEIAFGSNARNIPSNSAGSHVGNMPSNSADDDDGTE
ncbi:hypothetical protein PG984_000809 [Apiospora sp. TS-2023a]